MVYDENLAQLIRGLLAEYDHMLAEKKMFGGLSFMLQGNFACGLTKDDLVVRVGPERYAEALEHPHARPMDFTGKPMTGWVYVNPAGYDTGEHLAEWIRIGVDYALSLPPK